MKSIALSFVVCALACGATDDVTTSDETPSPVGGCTILQAGGAWWNQPFAEQRGVFHAEFDASASAVNLDAVVGLSDGAASGFAKLAAIVRFNPSGFLDVRDGATYRADIAEAYAAGAVYHFRFDIDLAAHRYSVAFRRPGTSYYHTLASRYAFRSEQASVARLTNVAGKIDSSTGGLEICNFAVVADGSTANDCVTAVAGGGFARLRLQDATVLASADFSATPSGANIDGVIGLSAGPAAIFNDLAAAVRFAPAGVLDARSGDAYRADVVRPYTAGQQVNFRVIADVTAHAYSVFEGDSAEAREIARRYAFRTQQAGIGHLDHLDVIVDGTSGSLEVCHIRQHASVGVAYSREGDPSVVALPGGAAWISDAAGTTRVDAHGQVRASLPRGGELAVDAAGNLFIARIANDVGTVEKLDASLATRWTRSWPTEPGARITAMATDPSGAVLVGMVVPDRDPLIVTRFAAADGAIGGGFQNHGDALAIDSDGGVAFARNENGYLYVAKYTNGAITYERTFAGNASVHAMAFGPDHELVFGGELSTAMDFGGGRLETRYTPDASVNGFVVALDAAGNHVFSRRTETYNVYGLASNGTAIAVSGVYMTQFFYSRLELYDRTGATVGARSTLFGGDLETHGQGGRVTIDANGRIYWRVGMQWPLWPRWPFMVVFE